MLIGWFIVLAHVALYFFFLTFFENRSSGIDWLACFFVYSQVMYWTLEGFYDAAAMVPMVLCARFLSRRRGLAAGLAYCAGAFVHFRVFFQAPWALLAAWIMLRNKQWRRLRRRDVAAILLSVAFALAALYVFWLDWASLAKVPLNTPLREGADRAVIWNFKVLLLACALAFLVCRAWFDLVTLAWLGLVLFSLRELCVWHLMISMSWVAVRSRVEAARGIRLAFLISTTAILFGDTFALNWLPRLYPGGGS
jgi:hypothetical protein